MTWFCVSPSPLTKRGQHWPSIRSPRAQGTAPAEEQPKGSPGLASASRQRYVIGSHFALTAICAWSVRTHAFRGWDTRLRRRGKRSASPPTTAECWESELWQAHGSDSEEHKHASDPSSTFRFNSLPMAGPRCLSVQQVLSSVCPLRGTACSAVTKNYKGPWTLKFPRNFLGQQISPPALAQPAREGCFTLGPLQQGEVLTAMECGQLPRASVIPFPSWPPHASFQLNAPDLDHICVQPGWEGTCTASTHATMTLIWTLLLSSPLSHQPHILVSTFRMGPVQGRKKKKGKKPNNNNHPCRSNIYFFPAHIFICFASLI